ncbi:MAG: hypothetical protein OEW75_11580 [Cyclobacteriaceae bacterium]|nr:hypothetical protein [Cyclobacteriaceae bacterium]
MKSFRFLTLILVITMSFSGCQVIKLAKKIKSLKAQAEMYADAFKSGDYQKMLDMTYPQLVEKLGGETQALAAIKSSAEQIKSTGLNFAGIETSEPTDVVQAGKELHSIITQKISIKVPGGFLDTELHFLAVSKDKGKTWSFIDTSRNNVKDLVPSLNPDLTIPKVGKPVFRRG